MAVLVEWDNKAKTIIRYTFCENWTWQELRDAVEERGLPMSTEIKGPVCYIIDVTGSYSAPRGIFLQMRYFYSVVHAHPYIIGNVVLIGANSFTRRLYQLVQRLGYDLVTSLQFADSLEEARMLLQLPPGSPEQFDAD